MKNFGARIIYRPGTANVLADYLSRPLNTAYAADEREGAHITRPKELNRVDLQAIHEHLSYNEPLPSILESRWVKKYFVIYNNHLHRVSQHSKDPGDPPHLGGLTTKAAVLLRVPETGERHQEARNAHYALGHGSVGAMQWKLDTALWHPELVLAIQQAIAEYPQYQLIKRPNITLPDLVPIKPPPPLTRWAINHTFWKESPILVMVEYATKWVKASFMPSKRWEYTLLMLINIRNRFGLFHKLINNNADKFSGPTAKGWHQQYNTNVHPTTPARPRGNGKMEQINGHIKAIMTRMHLIHSEIPLPDLL
jgi:hypothetical protein